MSSAGILDCRPTTASTARSDGLGFGTAGDLKLRRATQELFARCRKPRRLKVAGVK